jgi:predicted GH43/DUF377 family glycosyl hydrolase
MGCVVMQSIPPFAIVNITKEPILRGSEFEDLTITERAGCSHRKPLVVFPAGCVKYGEDFIVSCGVNDCQSMLVRVKVTDLKL